MFDNQYVIRLAEQVIDGFSDKRYLLDVPIAATISDQERKELGLPVNIMDGEFNTRYPLEMTTVYIPISQMLDIFDRGFTMRVKNYNDVTDITNRLLKAYEALSSSLVVDQYGLKELIGSFLETILNYNREKVEKEIKQIQEEEIADGLGMSTDFFDTVPVIGNRPAIDESIIVKPKG